MEVIFTARARRHLHSIKGYIGRKSYPDRAEAYVGRILDYCEGLSMFPKRGTARDDILTGLRVVGFERSANIAFVVTDDAVIIEGVFYGGQQWENQFVKRSD